MNKLAAKHGWIISENQKDVGTMGVRLECSNHYPGMKPHYVTAHYNLVPQYTGKRHE